MISTKKLSRLIKTSSKSLLASLLLLASLMLLACLLLIVCLLCCLASISVASGIPLVPDVLTVAGFPAVTGIPGVVCFSAVAFIRAVTGVPAFAGVSTIAGVLPLMASLLLLASLCYCGWNLYVLYFTMRQRFSDYQTVIFSPIGISSIRFANLRNYRTITYRITVSIYQTFAYRTQKNFRLPTSVTGKFKKVDLLLRTAWIIDNMLATVDPLVIGAIKKAFFRQVCFSAV
jgi:hypothetical protein